MIDLDHVNAVLARRNCFHLNDSMNIVYCPFDDRGNCHHRFHADSVDGVRMQVLNTPDLRDVFLSRENDNSSRGRGDQLNANLRGDRVRDNELFWKWSNH